MKTIVFTVFLKGRDIRIHKLLHAISIKNNACNPNMFFDTATYRIYRKVTQNRLRRETQYGSKINENLLWDTSGASTWPPKTYHNGLQGSPNGPKMAPGDPHIDPNLIKTYQTFQDYSHCICESDTLDHPNGAK